MFHVFSFMFFRSRGISHVYGEYIYTYVYVYIYIKRYIFAANAVTMLLNYWIDLKCICAILIKNDRITELCFVKLLKGYLYRIHVYMNMRTQMQIYDAAILLENVSCNTNTSLQEKIILNRTRCFL